MSNNNIKIKYAILCDDAFTSEHGKLNIIGIFDFIKFPKFPAGHAKFCLAIRLFGQESEDEHSIEVELFSGSNQSVAHIKSVFKIGKTKKSNFLAYFLNTIFEEAGNYYIKVKINGVDTGEKFDVVVEKEN